MVFEHRVLLVDSQYRQRMSQPEFNSGQRQPPWEWTGASDVLDGMSAAGWEHYQSLEITSPGACDNYARHGVMLYFRRAKVASESTPAG